MLRSPALLAGLALAAALVAAVPAGANGVDESLTVAATSGDCPDRGRCLVVVEGDIDALRHDHGVQIVFENRDDADHALHVAMLEDADPDRSDTPAEAAFASTDRVPPGGEGKLAFAPPTYADGVYLYSPLEDHEADGAWLVVPYGDAEASRDTPAAGPGLLVSLALAAALAGSRR